MERGPVRRSGVLPGQFACRHCRRHRRGRQSADHPLQWRRERRRHHRRGRIYGSGKAGLLVGMSCFRKTQPGADGITICAQPLCVRYLAVQLHRIKPASHLFIFILQVQGCCPFSCNSLAPIVLQIGCHVLLLLHFSIVQETLCRLSCRTICCIRTTAAMSTPKSWVLARKRIATTS